MRVKIVYRGFVVVVLLRVDAGRSKRECTIVPVVSRRQVQEVLFPATRATLKSRIDIRQLEAANR